MGQYCQHCGLGPHTEGHHCAGTWKARAEAETKRVDMAMDEVESLRAELEIQRRANKSVVETGDQLLVEIAEAKRELATYTSAAEDTITNLMARAEKTESELAAANERADEANEEIDLAHSRSKNYAKRLDSMQIKVGALEVERDEIIRRSGLDCGCGQHHWICHECVHKAVEAERDAMRGVIEKASKFLDYLESCRPWSEETVRDFREIGKSIAALPPEPSGRDEKEKS